VYVPGVLNVFENVALFQVTVADSFDTDDQRCPVSPDNTLNANKSSLQNGNVALRNAARVSGSPDSASSTEASG